MSRHALAALTITERLEQMELDMTAVHDAVAKLADRLDRLEQLVDERDESHVIAVGEQTDRIDALMSRLRDEPAASQQRQTDHTSAPVNQSSEDLFDPNARQPNNLMS